MFLAAAALTSGQSASLAPTGTLRAAFLGTNPVQARVDPKTGEVSGPVADLVKELARRIGTPFQLIPAPDAAAVIRHVQMGTADVGFLAFDEERAKAVQFAGGFAVMFNTYVVPAASPLQRVPETDRSGVRIGAVKGQTPSLFLSANLKNAQIQNFDAMPGQADLERLLAAGGVTAFAVNQQRAVEIAAASKGSLRALSGSFFDVEQSFVVKNGEKEKAAALVAFVEELKGSGFIKASIDRAKLVGVSVAPPRRH
jgi:polar amino acid transport system substrate-binding protein